MYSAAELHQLETHPARVDSSVQETLAMARNLSPRAKETLNRVLQARSPHDAELVASVIFASDHAGLHQPSSKALLEQRVLH